MRYYFSMMLLGLLFLGCSSNEDEQVVKSKNSLSCTIVKTSKARCTFKTARVNTTQGVEFVWTSPDGIGDERRRTITLPANHASVYDERNTQGRASGVWTISATLNGKTSKTSLRL